MERRVYVDCREHPNSNCTLRLSGTEQEVLDTVIQHIVARHGGKDTPETRAELRNSLKEEKAPAVA